jgi:hypothetical protein
MIKQAVIQSDRGYEVRIFDVVVDDGALPRPKAWCRHLRPQGRWSGYLRWACPPFLSHAVVIRILTNSIIQHR